MQFFASLLQENGLSFLLLCCRAKFINYGSNICYVLTKKKKKTIANKQ